MRGRPRCVHFLKSFSPSWCALFVLVWLLVGDGVSKRGESFVRSVPDDDDDYDGFPLQSRSRQSTNGVDEEHAGVSVASDRRSGAGMDDSGRREILPLQRLGRESIGGLADNDSGGRIREIKGGLYDDDSGRVGESNGGSYVDDSGRNRGINGGLYDDDAGQVREVSGGISDDDAGQVRGVSGGISDDDSEHEILLSLEHHLPESNKDVDTRLVSRQKMFLSSTDFANDDSRRNRVFTSGKLPQKSNSVMSRDASKQLAGVPLEKQVRNSSEDDSKWPSNAVLQLGFQRESKTEISEVNLMQHALAPLEQQLLARDVTSPPTDARLKAIRGKRCAIGQTSRDGLGHQLDGRFNLMLLEMLYPETFVYVHLPFAGFEHSAELNVSDVDAFFGFRNAFPTLDDVNRVWGNVALTPKLRVGELDNLRRKLKSNATACSEDVVYQFDGVPMKTLYTLRNVEKASFNIWESATFKSIRKAYHSTVKPETGFSLNRPNIVVHIRRGDAELERQARFEYLLKAMRYYSKFFGQRRPLFFIETDTPKWQKIVNLKKEFDYENIYLDEEANNDVRRSLHRMVQADGIVMSHSSLSFVAAMLNTGKGPFCVWGDLKSQGHRRSWLQQEERFVKIQTVINSSTCDEGEYLKPRWGSYICKEL